jgi:murein DD-endopeptidase MepM/ murein hydrolase activator NlpD
VLDNLKIYRKDQVKKSLFFKINTTLISSVFYFLSINLSWGGNTDTSATVKVHPKILLSTATQSMTKEQITDMVDQLLEMDTIPADVINELNIAIVRLKNKPTSAPLAMVAKKKTYPAADLYTSWEINKLFPEKDKLKLTGDTIINLTLEGCTQGIYFHPCNGPITSNFGWRDSTQHNGIDIDLNKGDKVSAAFNGMVRLARRYGGFGNVIIIRHYNGLETVYGHLSKIKVKPGQVVVAGQVIGLGGSTGHSTGSHLHFEVRLKGVPINPKYLISFSEQKLFCDDLIVKKTKWGLAAYPKDVKVYRVEKGDTVFGIAKRFGTTTSSIKEINKLPYKVRLKPGQLINLTE